MRRVVKDTVVLATVAIAVLSCNVLEFDDMKGGFPRKIREAGRQAAGQENPMPTGPDTTLWVSAVVFPEGYDWQRDTAYGDVDARIVLYRDYVPVLDVPASGGASAHRHHIIGEHLYIEGSAGRYKSVLRDDSLLFTMPLSQTLCGVLESGRSVYTMVRNVSGGGFIVRRGAETVFERGDGLPFGSFDDIAYAPGGSLYEDGGKCCFCYKSGSGLDEAYYEVSDFAERLIGWARFAQDIQDIRIVDGRPMMTTDAVTPGQWRGARIWPDGGPAMGGELRSPGNSGYACAVYRFDTQSWQEIGGEQGYLYIGTDSAYNVTWTQDGKMHIMTPGRKETIFDDCYCVFYPSCGTVQGDDLVLALTPKDTAACAEVICDDKIRKLKIRGFVSGIAMKVEDW